MGRRFLSLVILGWAAACGNATSSNDASGGAGGSGTPNTGGVNTAGSVDGPHQSTGGESGGSTERACAGNSGSPTNFFAAELALNAGGQGSAPRCLPRKLSAGDDGRVPCSVVEIEPMPCACDATLGLQAAPAALANAAWRQFTETRTVGGAASAADTCANWCVCELVQLSADALRACQTDPNVDAPPGYCYVDQENNAASSTLLSACPASQKRALRFLGHTGPGGATPARWFLLCSGTPLQP
ncbi:MAG TPA: hypothetical protein VG937_31965 [Polyangiaceae bacterium]|nr:hypothetical protein [Polyangiaceae bacterium]